MLEDKSGGAGLIIDCAMNAKSASTIIAMLESDAAEQGIAVERGAIAYLVERAGSDVALCANELEKCILRIGPGQTVTPRGRRRNGESQRAGDDFHARRCDC